jgi:hypothetical protein
MEELLHGLFVDYRWLGKGNLRDLFVLLYATLSYFTLLYAILRILGTPWIAEMVRWEQYLNR